MAHRCAFCVGAAIQKKDLAPAESVLRSTPMVMVPMDKLKDAKEEALKLNPFMKGADSHEAFKVAIERYHCLLLGQLQVK